MANSLVKKLGHMMLTGSFAVMQQQMDLTADPAVSMTPMPLPAKADREKRRREIW